MECAETLTIRESDEMVDNLARWLAHEGPPYTVEDHSAIGVKVHVLGADRRGTFYLLRTTWEAVLESVRVLLDGFGEDDPWMFERFEDEGGTEGED